MYILLDVIGWMLKGNASKFLLVILSLGFCVHTNVCTFAFIIIYIGIIIVPVVVKANMIQFVKLMVLDMSMQ